MIIKRDCNKNLPLILLVTAIAFSSNFSFVNQKGRIPRACPWYPTGLSIHFQHQDNSISRINFPRFSNNEWAYIARNQFAYCNRLRASDYLNLFNKIGFDIIHMEKGIDENSMNKIQDGFKVNENFTI